MKRIRIGYVVLVVLILFAGLSAWYVMSRGFSARTPPNAVEAFVAPRLRNIAIPPEARAAQNPVASSPEALHQAMEHFADHCSFCHAKDGSGKSEMGRGLYPQPPDMR